MSHLSFSTQNLLRLVQSQSCDLSQSGFVQPAARNLKIFCLLSYQIKKSSKSSKHRRGNQYNHWLQQQKQGARTVNISLYLSQHCETEQLWLHVFHAPHRLISVFLPALFVLNQILDQNLLTAQQKWVMRILTRHIYTDVTQPESKKTKKDFVEFMAKSSRQSIQPSYIYQQHYNNQ